MIASTPLRPATRPRTAALRVLVFVATAVAILGAPWENAFSFSLCSLVLWICCAAFLLLDRPSDPLAPANTVVMLYAAVFALGPLWAYSRHAYNISYLGENRDQLIPTASALALAGFLALVAGYFASTFWNRPHEIRPDAPEVAGALRARLLVCAFGLGAVGLVCYGVLVREAGGLGYFLNYSGGRSDIFGGVFGGWFWGTHLIFAGYGMYAVATARRHPWISAVFAIGIAMMFAPLQGRDLVIAPLYCGVMFFHRYHERLPWRTVIAGMAVAFVLAAFVGAFRQADKRSFFSNPVEFSMRFAYEVKEHVGVVISENIEQLDMVMVAERYVQNTKVHLGPLALMEWAKPIDRQLFGNSMPSIYTGKFMDRLVYPEHFGWNTALSPSLVGELLIGLGWAGVCIGMVCYGWVLGRLTRWYSNPNGSPVLYAVYPVVAYFFLKMIVDGTVHTFRPLLVFSAAAICSIAFPRRGRRRAAPARATT